MENMDFMTDGLSFGNLLKKCISVKMDENLLKELWFVNSLRKDYIHHFLYKSFDYSLITNHKKQLSQIPDKIKDYVFIEVGEIITDKNKIGKVGDIAIIR